ncbi:MAG: DUF481 domain-containing protein [Alphaproteobacteria bacterium]|nr:DUF481 domain-containing protein [Alphaproteobacteria bacterium]
MKKTLILSALLASPFAQAELSDSHKSSLTAAYGTGDSYVFETIKNSITSATSISDVEAFITTLAKPIEATTETVASIEPAAGPEKVYPTSLMDGWFGSVEGGFSLSSGNTEKRNLNAKLSGNREGEKWFQKGSMEARTTHEDDTRTEEEYRFKGEVGRKLSDIDYVFASANYVIDPFSSYDWRVDEVVGYGRYFIKEENMTLEGKAAIGGRHSQPNQTGAEREDELVVKPALAFQWNINEALTFGQDLSSTIGNELVVTESLTSLTNKMTDKLSLRANLRAEHTNKVPAGTKKLDTVTSLNVVYDF